MVDTLRRTYLHPYFVIKQVATRKAKSGWNFFLKKEQWLCIPRVIFYFSFNRFFKPIQSCHVWLRWEEKSSDKTSKIQSILIKIETRKKWVKTQSRINQKVAQKTLKQRQLLNRRQYLIMGLSKPDCVFWINWWPVLYASRKPITIHPQTMTARGESN